MGSMAGEVLAGPELDPFSLPSDLQATSGPLTPSTTTLPVDETYGGNAGFAFKITQAGSGNAGWFRITSPASRNRMALLATHTGEGIAARAIHTGRGRALWAQIPDPANPFDAFVASHVGEGSAVFGLNVGTGPAGRFEQRNPGSADPAVEVLHQGSGDALQVEKSGNGRGIAITTGAGRGLQINGDRDAFSASSGSAFDTFNNSVLFAQTTGTRGHVAWLNGNTTDGVLFLTQLNAARTNVLFRVRATNSSGDFAIYEVGNAPRIRFDRTGKGFFNGGTQSSGADLAESFAVEGPLLRHEPGDVLAISTARDRRVERSAEPYSTRVIGVHATRPGVLLSDESIDAPGWGRVPVGVVGVVPTKVTAEGGTIERGDLLVTSSTPGHAMKADPERVREGRIPNGAVLGKALEPFHGPARGLIEVMVNVK